MKRFLSSVPLWQNHGIALLRILIGIFLIIHGKEVFDAAKMTEYSKWDVFTNPSSAKMLVYLGKGAEFVAGFLLVFGLFTRVAALLTVGTFLYITFLVGNGKFWMDDQHPFLFALFGILFFFTGPGTWSLDEKLFNKS